MALRVEIEKAMVTPFLVNLLLAAGTDVSLKNGIQRSAFAKLMWSFHACSTLVQKSRA